MGIRVEKLLGLKRCEACPSLSTSFPNALSKHASHTFHSTHTHHTQSTSFPNALSIEDCVCPAGFKIALQDGAYARENCTDNPCECNERFSFKGSK